MASIDTYEELRTLSAEAAARADGMFSFGWGNGAWPTVTNGFYAPATRMGVRGVTTPSVPLALGANDSCFLPPFINAVPGARYWLSELEMNYGSNNMSLGRMNMLLYDRLCHSGGLSGIVTTEQTTNLPSAPLPRYTDGKGVMAFLEITAAIGSTATTATVRYTNEKGEAGRQSPPFTIGGSGATSSAIALPVPLQAGDKGVRSVEGVTLAATTGTQGNIAVVLAKVLSTFPVDTACQMERSPIRSQIFGGGVVEVFPDACFSMLVHKPTDGTGAQYIMGRIGVVSK
jgi:hypothetical protein